MLCHRMAVFRIQELSVCHLLRPDGKTPEKLRINTWEHQQFTYGVAIAKGFLRKICGNSAESCGNFADIRGTFSARTPSRTTYQVELIINKCWEHVAVHFRVLDGHFSARRLLCSFSALPLLEEPSLDWFQFRVIPSGKFGKFPRAKSPCEVQKSP